MRWLELGAGEAAPLPPEGPELLARRAALIGGP